MAKAPNYRPSDTNERCGTCRYSEDGRCTLYDMSVEPSYTCDSWVSAEETHTPVDASVMRKHSGVTLMQMAEKTARERSSKSKRVAKAALSSAIPSAALGGAMGLLLSGGRLRAGAYSARDSALLGAAFGGGGELLRKSAGVPFLKQDRPESVKRIYRALKRDHPNMPAEMKARIAARQGKPGKQKQGPPYKRPITKEATMQGPPKVRRASRQMMHQMLELLLGMYLLYYELHWKYRTHYGDHLLFQRMYEKVQEELDGLAEKLIGYHGADQLELIELVDGANSYIKLWTVGNEDFIGQGLKAEEALQTLFHKNYDELKELDALPMGFDDYIMAVCNDHETHTYLLQQVRAGRGKEKTAMPSKKDILKALAIGGGGAALGAGGGYVAGHRTGMARDRETPYSGKHMQFAYVKGQQDLARRLRERMMQRGGKTKKAASRKALAGTALASLLAGGGAGYAGGRVHGKKIDEKTPYSGKHMQFAYTKGQHDLAQRLRAAVAARRQAGKTKKAADSTWWERQEAANRAMRDPKATGVRKLLADEELIGKRVKGGLAGLAKGGLGGAAGGAALGALLGRKGRKKALAKYLAQFGGAGGAVAGQLKGTMDVDKEWLKERGITTRMGGLDLELSPKAKKKYLRKKASVENLVEYAFNEELEAIAQG